MATKTSTESTQPIEPPAVPESAAASTSVDPAADFGSRFDAISPLKDCEIAE